jgi:hypothetical protein
VRPTNSARRFAALTLAVGTALAAGCQQDVQPLPVATAAVVSADEPQAADRGEGPLALTWKELDIPLGPEQDFEPWMLSTAIKSLDGQQVRITGWMHEGVAQKDHIREFVLVKHLGCQFGREGQPQHVILVELEGKLRTTFTTEAVTVEGRFAVDPYTGPDGRTWALYRLTGTKIEQGES